MPLRFRQDDSFTILQFTDIHWSDGGEEDRRSRALMELLIETERPDLVVLTGDVIAGSECVDPAASWLQAVAALEEHAVSWAAVFGNHDDEGCVSRTGLMDVQLRCRMCLSEPGPRDVSGVGNYVLPIVGSEDLPAAFLYFLDSGSYAPASIGGYAWIEQDQIGWYRDISGALNPNRCPALAFYHIPTPQYNDVWAHYPCKGSKYEPVCCPKIDSGFFAALVKRGEVIGTFVGHDHVNDFEGSLHGIRLCYGRASGYHTYGREGFPRGARVIRLLEGSRDFETWIRLDNGEIAVQADHTPDSELLS